MESPLVLVFYMVHQKLLRLKKQILLLGFELFKLGRSLLNFLNLFLEGVVLLDQTFLLGNLFLKLIPLDLDKNLVRRVFGCDIANLFFNLLNRRSNFIEF